MLTELDLHDVTLVGFSMGGGEVARCITRHGQDRLHSVVFAAAVTPYMLQGGDNPEGPLTKHGDGDGTVPFEGSGKRTHEAIPQSQLHVILGAPHGCNVSHAEEFNRTLVDFLSI